MSEWFSKCAVGILVFSSLMGLGTAIHYRTKLTIEEKLNNIGLPILTKDDADWSTLFKKYQENNYNLKISDLEKEDWKSLRDWCLNKSKQYSTEENKELFKKISAWCTQPYTIKQWIENNKKRKIIKGDKRNGVCEVIETKHFLHEEDYSYLEFIKECTTD